MKVTCNASESSTSDRATTPVAATNEAPNFSSMRRALQASLLVAVLFPLAFIGLSAYSDIKDRKAAATDVVVRTARATEEHALKLLDIDAALMSRIADELGQRDDLAIRHDEVALHEMLQRVGGGYPQVAYISVFGADGKLLANNRFAPVPAVSIADRGDFLTVRRSPSTLYISGSMYGSVTHTLVFNVLLGRTDALGRFLGTVSIAMNPVYFRDFYRDLLGDGAPLHMALLRKDGAVLAHYPSLPQDITILPPHQPLSEAMQALQPAGVVTELSSQNQAIRIVAFRRVGAYDAYVTVSYPLAAIWIAAAWHTWVIGAATLLPSAALWLLLLIALRRLQAEEAAWLRLNQEAATRSQLEQAQRESQRLETLGNLVGAVAHDFNNLLMAISAHAQVALRRTLPLESDLRAIMRAVDHGQAVTRRLLGVARKQPLREVYLDLPHWANGFGLIQATLGDTIEFRLHIDPAAWPVHVDPAELELAILNVAINARDAMPHGGTFSLFIENRYVPQGEPVERAGDYVAIVMRDSGTGMSAELAARAFEPFYSTKPMGQGTGLGLPQCRAFCERSGGAVTLHSVPGAGASVTFYLPRASQAPTLTSLDAWPQGDTDAGSALLLVEDNPDVAEAEQALLSLLGHRVTWVSDASQALQLLHNGASFDVVLSDVQMPGGINGLDLVSQIQQAWPGLPVVLLTGYAPDLEDLEAQNVAVFAKPFDATVLHAYLLDLMRRKQRQPAL